MWGIAARGPHRGGEVDAQDGVPGFRGELSDRSVSRAAPRRIVDQDGEAAHAFGGGLHEVGARPFVAELGGHERRRATGGRDVGHHRVAPGLVAPGHHHRRALRREGGRDRAPKPEVEPVTTAFSPASRTPSTLPGWPFSAV